MTPPLNVGVTAKTFLNALCSTGLQGVFNTIFYISTIKSIQDLRRSALSKMMFLNHDYFLLWALWYILFTLPSPST